MRILSAIVEPATNFMTTGGADLLRRRRIGAKPVGDDAAGAPILLHDAFQELQRRDPVPLHSNHCLQNFPFVVNGAPEIAELAIDLHEDFVQMPSPFDVAVNARKALLPDLAANIGPNRFHQKRMVSWLMSIPRSASRSSTFRSESGYFTYIITTRRITSGELLKYRNGSFMTQITTAEIGPEVLI